MGKKSQRKGANAEREIAAILTEYGYDAERGGSMTYGSVPDVTGLPGIHIEVKRRENLNLLDAIRQAAADAERFQDGKPAVFHRKNRSPWLVTMPLEAWMQLYQAAENRKLSEKNRKD